MRPVPGVGGEDGHMRSRSLTFAFAVPVAAITLALLAGCALESKAVDPVASSTPTRTSTPTPTQTATPTSTPVSTVDGIPITITCDQLITPQAMYDYNPNFSLKADYKPAAGSLAAQVATQKGLTCGWVNQTSGDLIEVAVAHLPAAHLTELKNTLVTTSHSVPTYNVEGYFLLNGKTGEAQAFSDPYWIVATSTAFFEPGDAQPIVAAGIAVLK